MPKYKFSALDAQGQKTSGEADAASIDAMAQQIKKNGLTPLEILASDTKEQGKSDFLAMPSWLKRFQGKVPQKELQIFCRQMYTLLKAGIPLILAVTRLSETTRNAQLNEALHKILSALEQGRNLSYALTLSPKVFSDFFVNMVKVGENSGQLEIIFLRLTEYIELEISTKNKIKTALRYPKMVIGSVFIAVLVINAFVIPAFSQLFESFKGTLPLPTRILMGTSKFILHDWYIVIISVGGFIWGFRYWANTPKGKIQWAKAKLKIPVMGWIVYRITLARFAKLLSMVLRAGLTVVEGIQLVGASTEDAYFSSKIQSIAQELERGSNLSKAIQKTGLFPTLIIQMIVLGEESGNIDTLLEEVAGYYDREVAYDLAHVSEAIEPLLLVVVGAIVLVLALGVFLPLWDMTYQITHKTS